MCDSGPQPTLGKRKLSEKSCGRLSVAAFPEEFLQKFYSHSDALGRPEIEYWTCLDSKSGHHSPADAAGLFRLQPAFSARWEQAEQRPDTAKC